jgi:hypothetical protein
MSDSVKVVIILYAGFILSLLIANIIAGIVVRSFKLLRKHES